MTFHNRINRIIISIFTTLLILTGCASGEIPEEKESGTSSTIVESPSQNEAPPKTEELEELSSPAPLGAEGILSVEFIDVGQGDSILIVTPNGRSILIDAGDRGNTNVITTRLKLNEIEKLDVIIASHPHADHIGSMSDILYEYDPEYLFMPNAISTSKTFENFLLMVQQKRMTISETIAGTEIELEEGITLKFVSPGEIWSDINNNSAVLKLEYGDTSFLFAGDMESAAEAKITEDINVDVLKVGHHGSDTSSSKSFLDKTTPLISVISVGDNSYGHPSQTIIERLMSAGSSVYRTDVSGTIRIESDGTDVKVVNAKSLKKSDLEASAPDVVPAVVPVTPSPAVEEPSAEEEVIVYVTQSGTKYHNDGCRHLSKSQIETTLKEAVSAGLEPCSVCNPPQ